ncbi:aldehyde oxidase 1-like [Salmo trutta]|uniref:aldehyde oxidase 1-like n=1 Tax=Salmo trutta TaxID=8032 RepID=UPI0011311D70|nr:aldehyde oxidase 1-like [Salmo trutta]
MQVKGVHHSLVIYAGSVSDLHTVTWGKDGVSVGAVCTLSSLKEEMERAAREMEAERTRGYQALLQTLQCLAGKQIRNMATIGVNILSANPKYDLNSVLAALDCTLQVQSKENGTREITLNEELFTGFGKTALRPDEVLLSIDIPYSKPAQRREFAFSIVNAGMKVVFRKGSNKVESLNIYYGGVGPTLVKVGHTCQKLVGQCVD